MVCSTSRLKRSCSAFEMFLEIALMEKQNTVLPAGVAMLVICFATFSIKYLGGIKPSFVLVSLTEYLAQE